MLVDTAVKWVLMGVESHEVSSVINLFSAQRWHKRLDRALCGLEIMLCPRTVLFIGMAPLTEWVPVRVRLGEG
jgi:hypothetical protein